MPSLTVKPITDKNTWEKFVLSQPNANFLQSWNWGLFNQRLGKTIYRLGLFQSAKLLGTASAIKETAIRGQYLTIPAGPLIDWQNPIPVSTIIQAISRIARRNHCSFIRLRPQVIDSPTSRLKLSQLGFILSPMHLTADLTLELNLNQSLDQLLSQMRKSTRYEIKKAAKIGLKTITSTNLKDIRPFHQHQLALARQHHFIPFSYDFLYHQFKTFVADNQALLFHTYHQHQLLASAFIIFYHHQAIYHYGISTPQNHRLPGSHACLWNAIKHAQKLNCRVFNFWGIAPQNQPHHRFAGVSVFKRGFGGQEVSYLPAHDLPLNWHYWPTYIFETLRKKIRKL
jgi:lipid II:glycine glycyltransferase (peptidoglycan interpeptide bridge formation enzyme)